MKIKSISILERTDSCIIAELTYSVLNIFAEKEVKRQIFKENNGFGDYWFFLDTREILIPLSDSINAMVSTNKNYYEL